MNILEMLEDELKDKDWSTEIKARYLYIRSCELFSYDPRLSFVGLIDDGPKLENKIINNKIDLENVSNNWVVCTSHEAIYNELLTKILGIDTQTYGNGHKNTIFFDTKRNIKADATINNDLTRVKMGLHTYGYTLLSGTPIEKKLFYKKLTKIDKTINYLKNEYQNITIKNYLNNLENEFYQKFGKYGNPENDDYLIYRLYAIKDIFDKYKNLFNFYDAEYCLDYLFFKSNIKDIHDKFEGNFFERISNDNWIFINGYRFCLNNESIYFMLKEENKNIFFQEVGESEINYLCRTLKGYNKWL